MRKKTIVAKFGGTSLADADQFQKIKAIVEDNPERRFLVASAPGKRYAEDIKITDRFIACWQLAKRKEHRVNMGYDVVVKSVINRCQAKKLFNCRKNTLFHVSSSKGMYRLVFVL